MKREVISEAIKNISEDYRLEALETHNKEVVSEITSMKKSTNIKKLIIIGTAATLTLALGITAYAKISSINARTPEVGETVTVNYPALDIPVVEDNPTDDKGNVIEEASGEAYVIHQDAQSYTYDNISQIFTFNGPSECNEIEFMATYLPEDYEIIYGALNEWTDFIQGDYDTATDCYNINVYYSAQFGSDGCIFMDDNIHLLEESQDGDYRIYCISTTYNFDDEVSCYYYMMYNEVEGYLIVVDATESMDLCEDIASSLQIRQTGNVLTADDFYTNSVYLNCAVG